VSARSERLVKSVMQQVGEVLVAQLSLEPVRPVLLDGRGEIDSQLVVEVVAVEVDPVVVNRVAELRKGEGPRRRGGHHQDGENENQGQEQHTGSQLRSTPP